MAITQKESTYFANFIINYGKYGHINIWWKFKLSTFNRFRVKKFLFYL